MRLAALLLAALLPVQASACLVADSSPEGLDDPCRPAEATADLPSAHASSDDILRPRARPDRLAEGPTATEGPASEDPLLSPQAELFWSAL